MRKTIFCMWPTVMKVSTGSEWWKPGRWEHLDSGVRGGVCVGLGGRGGLPPWRRQKAKVAGNTTPHTPFIIFSPAQLIFFAASSAQGESMSGRSCWLSFARGMEMMSFHSIAVN